MRVKEIVILALLTTILIVQEQILAILPNIQLTFLLIFLYTKVLGFKKSVIIISIYVVIDCLINSSLGLATIIPMFIGWQLIPLTLCTVAKKLNSATSLAILSIPLSIAYALCFAVAVVIVGQIPIREYLIADIPFTLVLALSSFLTIWWLYSPMYKFLNNLHHNTLKK